MTIFAYDQETQKKEVVLESLQAVRMEMKKGKKIILILNSEDLINSSKNKKEEDIDKDDFYPPCRNYYLFSKLTIYQNGNFSKIIKNRMGKTALSQEMFKLIGALS